MRLFRRTDTPLAAALIVAAFVLFRQPLQYLADAAYDVQRRYHVDLLQSLAVLITVFAFHQYRKRQEGKAALVAAATEAEQARLRSQELERLVSLGRALALATDFKSLHHAFVRHLPNFVHERSCWLLICHQAYWDVLVRGTDDHSLTDELESIAERALVAGAASADYVRVDGHVCFPMMVGVHPVGIIVVNDTPELAQPDCCALEAAAALAAISVRNVQTLLQTRENGLRDGLTGCFNRAYALDTLHTELRRAQRSGTPLSMIMFDVDEFKQVNDSHGHLTGDRVLAEVGRRLGEVLRTSDVKCRYGGDEFVLILPDTPATGARQLAESLRQDMSRVVVRAGDGEVGFSVSVGVVTATAGEHDTEAFIARADAALYNAKRSGRNCVQTDVGEPLAPLRLVSTA